MIDNPMLGLSQRLPPSNVQAEQALLGSLMANNMAYRHVAEFLAPEHFADPVHGQIYAAIQRRVGKGQLADALTLRTEFENTSALEEVGGTAYLGQLLTASVGIINAREYGRAIRDAWLRRHLIDIGEEIVNRAFGADPEMAGADQLEEAMRRLREIADPTPQQLPEGFQIVDGSLVDMREPPASELPVNLPCEARTDLYDHPMLLTTSLDRQEVLVLADCHRELKRNATILARTAERDHHAKRLTLFSDALLEIDPMEPDA